MNPKLFEERRVRIQKLNRALKKLFPNAEIELNYHTPWELLVAVQLSARCTDKMVNKITAKLFKKYKTLEAYVRAQPLVFEQDIKSSGFYRNKSKNILASAKIVKNKFGGIVPKTMEEMLTLPGVARKTATVVLREAYGITAGVTVDTHVIRFCTRYDLSTHRDPVKIEKDLMRLLPQGEWGAFTHLVIHYGRYLAPARQYDTGKDPLVKIYPKAAKKFRV